MAALWIDAALERSRRRYRARTQGAECDGAGRTRRQRIVASALVGHDGHRGWVYYVAVDPDCRHKGYGRVIMDAAEDWLRARGIEKLQLMVRPDNGQVQAFYQSLGYVEQARIIYAKWLDRREPTP